MRKIRNSKKAFKAYVEKTIQLRKYENELNELNKSIQDLEERKEKGVHLAGFLYIINDVLGTLYFRRYWLERDIYVLKGRLHFFEVCVQHNMVDDAIIEPV